MTWDRRLKRLLWRSDSANPIRRQLLTYHKAKTLVGVFYAFNLSYAFYQGRRWKLIDSLDGFDPMWPVMWAGSIPSPNVVFTLLNLATATVAMIFPSNRAARLAATIGLFLHTAFIFSFGAMGHAVHFLIWTSFLFIFLPTEKQGVTTRKSRQVYLFVFWAAQFLCLFFYSMSGGFKLLGAAYQLYIGEVTVFHPSAAARHIASVQLTIDNRSMLGDFFIPYMWIGWPALVFSVILESASVLIAFRPRWHRLWGIGLLMMHMGIGLTMDVWFMTHFFMVALLLVNSPFTPDGQE